MPGIDITINPQGAKSGAQQVNTAIDSVIAKARQMDGAVGTSTANMGTRFNAVAQQALAFGAAMVSVQAILGAGRSIVDTTVKMESLSAAFKGITGSATQAGKEMEFVKAQAARLGFSNIALAESYKTVLAASRGTQLEGQATQEVFLAIAEAGRVFQLSNEDIKGSLLAVGQMMSKGVVSAEELRGQLGERLPGAFQIAARAMGVSTQELGKMLEQGQVLATDFLPKFSRQIREELGGAVEDAAKTASANFSRFGNAINDLANTIGSSGLVSVLSEAAALMAKMVKNASEASEAIKLFKRAQADFGSGPSPFSGQAKGIQESLLAKRQQLDELGNNATLGSVKLDSSGITFSGPRAMAEKLRAEILALEQEYGRVIAKQKEFTALTTETAPNMTAFVVTGELLRNVEKMNVAHQKALDTQKQETQLLYGRLPTEQEVQKLREKQADETKKLLQSQQAITALEKNNPAVQNALKQLQIADQYDARVTARSRAERAAIDAATKAGQEQRRIDELAGQQEQQRQERLTGILETVKKQGMALEHSREELERMAAIEQGAGAATLATLDALQKRRQALEDEKHTTEELLKIRQRTEQEIQKQEARATERGQRVQALEQTAMMAEHEYALAQQVGATSKEYKLRVDILRETSKWLQENSDATTQEAQRAEEAIARTARMTQALERMRTPLADFAEDAKDTFAMMQDVGTNAIQGLEDAIVDFAKTGKFNFKDMVDSLMSDIMRMSTKSLLTGPLAGMLNSGMSSGGVLGSGSGSLFGGLFNGLFSSGSGVGDLSYLAGGGFSTGGIVGMEGARRMIPASAMVGAPGFARGGIAGYGTDTFPAMLTPGEAVLTRGQMKALAPVSAIKEAAEGQGQPIQVNNTFHIQTPDAASFRRSQNQIASDVSAAIDRTIQRDQGRRPAGSRRF